MKKVIAVWAMWILATGAAIAADKPTPDDAKTLVKKAVALVKSSGKEKAIAEFNNTKGAFVSEDRQLYVFVIDKNGSTLANGANPRLVGKNVLDLRDVDGKSFIKEMIKQADAKGTGWIDYKFSNLSTNKIEDKSTYFEKVDDVVVACGIYK